MPSFSFPRSLTENIPALSTFQASKHNLKILFTSLLNSPPPSWPPEISSRCQLRGRPSFGTPRPALHLRNLPWECTEEELIELCKPFGKIVNTKCNVGANRNQAFVELVDLNQAVSYHASSSEPAQVRGKTLYFQYSNRHEIVNNKSPGDVPGNVLW